MSAPVKHTCPDIDRAIRHLTEAISYSKNYIEEKKDFRDVEYEIDWAINLLEDLRQANDKLRKWGDELEDELQSATKEISLLEERIESITSEALNKQPVKNTPQ